MEQEKKLLKYRSKVLDKIVLTDIILRGMLSKYSVEALFKVRAGTKVEEVVTDTLNRLRREIFNHIYMNCEYTSELASKMLEEKNNKALLLLFFNVKYKGETIQERVDSYVELFKGDLSTYLSKNYKGKDSAFKLAQESIIATNAPFSNTGFNDIKKLIQNALFGAFSYTAISIYKNRGANGWYTKRGSSLPCEYCDSWVGVFHPSDEFFYGYHNRCMCIIIPVYEK